VVAQTVQFAPLRSMSLGRNHANWTVCATFPAFHGFFDPPAHPSENRYNKTSRVSRTKQPPNDPVKTAILIFLTLFLTFMAVATLAGGIIVALKNNKIALGLFAVFGGIVKGMLSVIKMLIK
jgi:hypothetical protein